ncbi:hypothetical protein F4553_000453 [Allocatelliglobosispora scoriae]|uniref:Condensation domain-containing protein n=1 Tax=Allocatelliglobosispora scoriae TaxID=643052 RepID=A0A841BFK6_9ACTN|nr:condensation domain-containing protein [Allocatelliglobosispora scoriae]MBB5867074.1 hypothetical protein [Allocatelliglobosispora scoriae]
MHFDLELDIAFSAGRSGAGPATWGQHAIWDAMRTLGTDAARYNVAGGARLDPPITRSRLTAVLGELACLHDSLRTRLSADDGGLRQVVYSRGAVPLVVRQSTAEELGRSANVLYGELRALPFDVEHEWPVRVGAVEVDGLVHHVVFALSHTASDGWGVRNLIADFTDLCGGRSVASILAGNGRLQPLDEAGFQASGRGRRRDAAARRFWRDLLHSGPPNLFPATAGRPAAQPFPNAVLHSPALALATEHVARYLAVSPASVLLAAAAASMGRLTGVSEAVFQVVVNNRFLPGLADVVNTVAQEGLLHVAETDGDFSLLVRRTFGATVSTHWHAYYDKLALDSDIATSRDRGDVIGDHSCVVNDFRGLVPDETWVRPEPVPLARALSRTVLTWPVEFEPRPNLSFALDAAAVSGAIELAMTADSAVLPRPDMERFLFGIESLVVGEALAHS